MKNVMIRIFSLLSALRDLPPLFFRLILAYGFYGTAVEKVRGFDSVIEWFRDGLHLPFPVLNAYMATSTEVVGVICLTLGLFTRLISIPLMVVMIVAIVTVHWVNGFSCGKEGFEIPFYYFFMLFSLLVGGAGRVSLDALIAKKLADK